MISRFRWLIRCPGYSNNEFNKSQHRFTTLVSTLTDTLLRVQDLAVFRGEHCLFSGLNFSVAAGEVLQLHGDNGSGKTSLIRALCTLLPIEQGTISWRGVDLPAGRDQYFAEMSYAGHTEAIKGDLSAYENLAFFSALRGTADTDIEQAIARVGLATRSDLPCRSLSAGQRRRVSLARLQLSASVLWILDEPLTSLDVQGRALVEKLIVSHAGNGGAVIFTTHQPLSLDDCDVRSLELKY